MGTWFLGRLQTARDKERVIEGLEGAAAQSGKKFDRQEMESTLAALGNRVFLMNNVHEDAPTVFQSRWALSFLRGPLSRQQIQQLMNDKKSSGSGLAGTPQGGSAVKQSMHPAMTTGARPIVPADVAERFLIPSKIAATGNRLLYRPAVLGQTSVHYVKPTSRIDYWRDVNVLAACSRAVPDALWNTAVDVRPDQIELATQPGRWISICRTTPSAYRRRKTSMPGKRS